MAELHENLAKLYQENFENISKDYSNQLNRLEHLTNTYQSGLDALEKKGLFATSSYYESMRSIEEQNIGKLNSELIDLQKAFNAAMNSGEIAVGSEAWHSMTSEIEKTKEAIDKANISIIEMNNNIRDLAWSQFDYAQERVNRLTTEADFLIDLLDDEEMYDDNGQFNDRGMAAMGMHGSKYNTYMAQSRAYLAEMQSIERELANDPYNKTLIERRDALLDKQRESIQAAQQEKQAVVDLVKEGINREISSLQDLIDKFNKAQDEAKTLYEYQQKLEDQTGNVAKLRKRLASMEGDTSEENQASLQKLREELKKAQRTLEETQRDQSLSDTKTMLDDLMTEYSDVLNERLDDIGALFSDMMERADANAGEINSTITSVAGDVGYTINGNMIGMLQTTNSVLAEIDSFVAAMVGNSSSIAAAGLATTPGIQRYASGGLVRKTGFAYLDGTASKPELVLSPSDTANFIALKDALASKGTTGVSAIGIRGGASGDVYMNISIDHVEDYNDFVNQLRNDSQFERLIRSMTVDRLNGGSSLAKNKFKW